MKQFNEKILLKGKVITGLGTGKFFVTKEKYKRQFIKKIGYKPYEGTLNLKIKTDDRSYLIKHTDGILITGFREGKKTFGSVICLNCTLKKDQKKTEGTIVLPKKTHYTNIIEIIAPLNLRKTLNLKNSDSVEITLNA
jgi:riboflavin kinase